MVFILHAHDDLSAGGEAGGVEEPAGGAVHHALAEVRSPKAESV